MNDVPIHCIYSHCILFGALPKLKLLGKHWVEPSNESLHPIFLNLNTSRYELARFFCTDKLMVAEHWINMEDIRYWLE